MSKILNQSHLWEVLKIYLLLGYMCKLRLIVFSILASLKQQKNNHVHKMKTLFKVLGYFFLTQFGNSHYNSFIQSYQRGVNFLDSWSYPFKHQKLFLCFLDCSVYNNHIFHNRVIIMHIKYCCIAEGRIYRTIWSMFFEFLCSIFNSFPVPSLSVYFVLFLNLWFCCLFIFKWKAR